MKCDEGAPQGLCVLRDARHARRVHDRRDPRATSAASRLGQGRCAADSMCQGTGASLLGARRRSAPRTGDQRLELPQPDELLRHARQPPPAGHRPLALVEVLKSTTAKNFGLQLPARTAASPIPLDKTKIGFLGHSLGGILGHALHGRFAGHAQRGAERHGRRAGRRSSSTRPVRVADEGAPRALAAQGRVARDAGVRPVHRHRAVDPRPGRPGERRLSPHASRRPRRRRPRAASNRKAFIQFIEGDRDRPECRVPRARRERKPRASSRRRRASAARRRSSATSSRRRVTRSTRRRRRSPTRHGFFLEPPAGAAGSRLTAKAQTQMSTFLATGALP